MPDVRTDTMLDRILERTRADVALRKCAVPPSEYRGRPVSTRRPIGTASVLRADTVSVIAEIKRASPSKGRFPVEVDPVAVASDYCAGGARMISCLTDGPFFQGSLRDLDIVVRTANEAVPRIGVLRKDFIVDPYQVDEARAHGASCILLIVAALDDENLAELHAYAQSLGLSVLVEVHDEPEAERALRVGPSIIGINNRSLKTLDVDLKVTERVARGLSDEIVIVGESGIFTVDDVNRMADAGVDAILVGESLIVDDRRVESLRSLGAVKSRRKRRSA